MRARQARAAAPSPSPTAYDAADAARPITPIAAARAGEPNAHSSATAAMRKTGSITIKESPLDGDPVRRSLPGVSRATANPMATTFHTIFAPTRLSSAPTSTRRPHIAVVGAITLRTHRRRASLPDTPSIHGHVLSTAPRSRRSIRGPRLAGRCAVARRPVRQRRASSPSHPRKYI